MKKVKSIEEYKTKRISWNNEFIQLDKYGNEYPVNSKENMIILLNHYKISVRFNLLTKKMEIKSKFKNVSEDNLNSFVIDVKDLITKHKFKGELSTNRVTGILEAIAWENKFNPIKEYFDTLDYKNYKNLDEVTKVFNLLPIKFEKHREFYFSMYIKWLRHFIIPHYEPEFRPQLCLILKGKQRTGKSTFFRNLIPKHLREQYFHDKQLNLDSKDSLTECTTKMLVEIGELGDSFKDINKIKMFMTQDKDEIRTPYATYSNIYKRMTVFGGTVNDDEFLRDETGNTRFPIIETDKVFDFKALSNIDINKFWSEILYNYFNVSKVHYLEGNEVDYINDVNKRYKKYSYELSLLESVFDLDNDKKSKYWLKSGDIWRILGKQQRVSKNRLTRELKNRGVISKEKNKQSYFGLNKPDESDLPKNFNWNFEKATNGNENEFEIINCKIDKKIINNAIKYIKSINCIEHLNILENAFKSTFDSFDFDEIMKYIELKRDSLKSNQGSTLNKIVESNLNKNKSTAKINTVDNEYDFIFDIKKVNLNMNYPTNTVLKIYFDKNKNLVVPDCKEELNFNMINNFYKDLNLKPGMSYEVVSNILSNKKESRNDSIL